METALSSEALTPIYQNHMVAHPKKTPVFIVVSAVRATNFTPYDPVHRFSMKFNVYRLQLESNGRL